MNEMVELDCEYSDEFIKKVNQLREIYHDKKYIIGIDYGNDKSLHVEGYFRINIHRLFKKRRCGRKYKYFKTRVLPFNVLEFVGKRVVTD